MDILGYRIQRIKNKVFDSFDPNASNNRAALFEYWEGLYDNSAYDSNKIGGQQDIINGFLGERASQSLAGLYNPIQRVIDLYKLNVFAGVFGKDIDVTGSAVTVDAIHRMWAASLIDKNKKKLVKWGANFGTVGIRIVANDGKPIYFKFEHPSIISDVEYDDVGNVVGLILEYEQEEGDFGQELKYLRYKEILTTEQSQVYRDEELIKDLPNRLGVVPYVIHQFSDDGGSFGYPAFYGQDMKVHQLNWLASHINTQIGRHVNAKWLISGSGPKPKRINLGDDTLIYIEQRVGETVQPKMEALVASLNLRDSIAQSEQLLTEIENSMPELKATDGTLKSHQPGESFAQLRLPAEQRLKDGREGFQYSLKQAHKIGTAFGVLRGDWDIGTGQGINGAISALTSKEIEHEFNERELLPRTVQEQLAEAQIKALALGQMNGPPDYAPKPAATEPANKSNPPQSKAA